MTLIFNFLMKCISTVLLIIISFISVLISVLISKDVLYVCSNMFENIWDNK